MEINTQQIVEVQKALCSYSQDYSIDNDVRVSIYQANKVITSLVEELAKYKSLGDYSTLQRLTENTSNLEKAVMEKTTTVFVQTYEDEIQLVDEKEYHFDNIQSAVQFVKGKEVPDWNDNPVSLKENDSVEKVEMTTYFDVNALENFKENTNHKEFASSYIGCTLYRIDTDPNMGEYEVKAFPITSVQKYWDGNLVLKSGEEDVCLFEDIDTEKPFLDYYITFSSKEKAEVYVANLKEKEGEELDER